MKRIFLSLAALTAVALPLASARAADTWHEQIFAASKVAEQQVVRRNVQTAALRTSDDDSSSASTRRKPKRASNEQEDSKPKARHSRSRSSDEDRPQRRARSGGSGGSVNWTADSGCLDGTLRGVIRSLASDYGSVTVNSTCRSRSHNANVGGAPKSYHLKGEAVDFRVNNNISAAYASLRTNGSVGGLKHYGGGLFHIDTGPRRSW